MCGFWIPAFAGMAVEADQYSFVASKPTTVQYANTAPSDIRQPGRLQGAGWRGAFFRPLPGLH